MSAETYFKELIYPVGDDGLADTSADPMDLEIIVSNFHGNHQIYIQLDAEKGGEESSALHLTKAQAMKLGNSLHLAAATISYDNTQPAPED